VPTIHQPSNCEMVGTLRFAHPTASRNGLDSSPLLRRNIPQARGMCRNILDAVLQMHPLVRGQLLRHAHPRPPLGRWPDRPRRKAATAVRADVMQLVVHAIRAERAFVGTDPRVGCVRRQILVAIFAVRPKLQRHGDLFALIQTIIANPLPKDNGEYPSISAMPLEITAPIPLTAASRFPSTGRARSTSAHARRSGAASARC
jgi:hypothetical protein